MQYISRQRLTVRTQGTLPAVILLAGLDPIFSRILALHLENNFSVVISEYNGVEGAIRTHKPHVTVFDTGSDLGRLAFLKGLLLQFPGLSVITTSTTLDETFMDKLMGLGVRGHINRQFSRPQDIAELVKESLDIK